MNIKRLIRANKAAINAAIAALALLALPVLSQDTGLFPVPDSYQVEGIPPIKKSDVDHLFYDPASIRSNLIWSAYVKNRRLLVTDETNNIHLVAAPLSTPVKLTDRTVPEAVKMAPHGRSFAFTSDHENEDNHNLYVCDFQKKRPEKLTELTGKDESIDSFVWDESGKALFYMRVDYDTKQSKLCRHDLVVEKCYPPQMKGTWDVIEAFRDKILLKYFKGSSNQYLYLYNLDTDKTTPLDEQGNCRKAAFGDSGKSVIWTSEGNQTCSTQPCLLNFDISRGRLGQVKLPSDFEYLIDVKLSPGGQRIMFQETRNGVDSLRVFPIKNGILGAEYQPFIPDTFVVWNTR